MVYFYLYLILFLVAACFDIWVRRFFMLPVAFGSMIAIFLLLANIHPLTVVAGVIVIVGFMYILRYQRKKK